MSLLALVKSDVIGQLCKLNEVIELIVRVIMNEEPKVQFKGKKHKKILRQQIKSDESDDNEETEKISNKLHELKEIQQLRKRPHGVNVIGLALGAKMTLQDQFDGDPFKTAESGGGMINMQALKSGKVKQIDDAYDTGIGTQFSVETNKRDEDEEMMKYIEEELSKRNNKGNNDDDDHKDDDENPSSISSSRKNKNRYLSPEEAALQAVPEHLRVSSAKRSEEMLSNQMLNGIPEVDLGIEAKIKNIEATEEAKLRLLWENSKKKDGPSQFVPTNMAVNFVQHNRFNIDQSELLFKKKPKLMETDDDKAKKKEEKATDDYYFEKFKKQFRR